MRATVTTLLAAAALLVAATPAAPPDYPVTYIHVDELKTLLDRGAAKVDIIDVRTWNEYEAMHIAGARSMPLRSVRTRATEISRTGAVVLY